MINFIFKIASVKPISVALVLLLFLSLFVFSRYGVYYHSNGFNPLDMRMSYTATDVVNYFNRLGADGRKDYCFAVSWIDTLFPFIYGALIVLQLALLIKVLFKSNSLLFLGLVILPIGMVIFDYLENLNTLKMLDVFPNISPGMASAGTCYTSAKLYLSFICMFLITVGYVFMIIKKYANKA